eukprot:CAMPEP_0176353256 /NCGR_PEP_ID=MMETSP0126-20121128/11648_1 /TAXON_ID=141414 ORGANISM="Strombidinopsis acuminatum, Strain SPMC142" /NCGR_SAMPLE_ID=MMETSP0126 /ASSEMBLY_ACC=CAM_ASM_000229 /LENGTH=39 /DNA_ID= /DNA_START= /DNA_END= /DNA_ORIENTATION=
MHGKDDDEDGQDQSDDEGDFRKLKEWDTVNILNPALDIA